MRTTRPTDEEQLFLLSLARVVVGRYGFELSFARVEVFGLEITARPPYGFPSSLTVWRATPTHAYSSNGRPMLAHDIAAQLRKHIEVAR